MKNPPRALLAKLFNRTPSSAFGALGARHLITPTLLPPNIPANHTGGINQGHLDSGEVPVVVPIYFGYETNQNVVLYLNDNPVDTRTVIDETQALLTYIPARELPRGDSDNVVHYHGFTGFAGVNEESSYPVNVRVKTSVPGNPPGDPAVPGVNPYLAAPTGVPVSIPDLGAITGVTVGIPVYDNMAIGDVITVFWGGAGVSAPALVAGQPGQIIYVLIPWDIIAARPGRDVVVRYHVYDAVRNYSLYSQSALCNVTPVATLAEPIIVREVSDTLNIDGLAGSDIEIMVFKGTIDPAADVTLHFTGQPTDWPYLDFTLGPITFGTDPFHTFTVPNVLGRSLVNSEVIVFYEAVSGGNTERSANAQAQVIGTAINLPAPVALDAPGGLLDPDKITGATFDVTAPANTAFGHDTQVQLVWEGFNGAGDTFHHELIVPVTSATAGAAVIFKVQKGWAEEIAGGSVETHYNLIVPGTAPVTYFSAVLPLNVAGQATLLPLPDFEPALTANDELDVDKLTTTFNVKVNVTNAAFVGGTLKVHWQGQAADDVLEAPINATGVIRVSVDRTRLIDPNLDQIVDVWYEIVRPDGRIGRSGHVLVSVINSASQAWPMPEVWDSTGKAVNPLNPVKAGTSDANTATVVVRDSRLSTGDYVGFVWTIPGQSSEIIHKDVNPAGEVHAELPVSVFAASVGKTVTVSYVVYKGNVAQPVSQVLNLRVLELPPTALKAPRFVEATGTPPVLDLNTVTGNATVAVDPWPLIAEGQTFWLRVHGTRDDGDPYSERLATPYTVQTSEVTSGIRRVVERSLLLRLENASTLKVELKVDLSGTALESAATLFPEGDAVMATVKLDLPAPVVTGAENGYLDPAGIPATGVNVQVRAYSGQAPKQWVYVKFTGQNGSKEETAPVEVQDTTTPMDFKITKAEVLKNEKQAVTFEYKVARTKDALFSDSEAVPIFIDKNTAVPSPDIDGFEDLLTGEYTTIERQKYSIRKDTYAQTLMVVTKDDPTPPFMVGKYLYARGSDIRGEITITLKHPVVEFRMGVKISGAINGYMIIGGKQVPFSFNSTPTWFGHKLTNPSNPSNVITEIKFLLLRAELHLDNIEFVYWEPSF